jgi:hypothetical protein
MYTIGKQTPKYNDKTKGEKFLFTLNITNTITQTMTLQLFNVLKSVIYDGSTQNGVTFKPFTINDTELIIAGTSNVGILTNGSLNYKDYPNSTNLTAATPSDQNLTYRDIFSMISAGQYLQLSRIQITSSLREQLTQGTLNVVNISTAGQVNRMSVPLLTYFDGNQNQNKIIDVFINTELCKNQGLEFSILANSTATIQFYLEA